MRVRPWVIVLSVVAAIDASAADLTVTIDNGHGQPAADAVVSLRREDALQAEPHAAVTRIIDQRHETFLPYVEIFRPGDQVVFRNSDRTRHHVYSFSVAKTFEFVIAPGEESPPVTLDRTGEIAVGCNIHDHMITHLVVSDAPWVSRSDASGRVEFASLPKGTYTLDVWHPQLRPGRQGPHETIEIGDAAATLKYSMPLLPDPRETGGRARY
jgi:plastocyanin